MKRRERRSFVPNLEHPQEKLRGMWKVANHGTTQRLLWDIEVSRHFYDDYESNLLPLQRFVFGEDVGWNAGLVFKANKVYLNDALRGYDLKYVKEARGVRRLQWRTEHETDSGEVETFQKRRSQDL